MRPIRSEWESLYLKALDDMRKEARTLAALNHENIVSIHDVIWGNGSVFCVMPWLESGSLKARMSTRDFTAEQSMQWLRLLLDALCYLHDRGIIHRDLKPDNIMFNEAGNPVIIDFGAALNRPELTTTTTQGSFSRGYAAPEQITGKGKVGPWTDFYALSATWYELLTGIRPEASDARLMQDDMPSLLSSECLLNYPRDLVNILQQNLSLKPIERCQTVEQWLQCWKDGTLPPLELPAQGKIHRRIAALVAIGALMGGLFYAAGVVFPQREEAHSSADPDEVKTRLMDKMRSLCKWDEYESLCAEAAARSAQIDEECSAREQSVLTLMEKQISQLRSSEDVHRFLDTAMKEYTALCNDRSDRIFESLNAFEEAIRPFCRNAAEMSELFHPANGLEADVLSTVCLELENQCRSLYDDVQIRHADVSSVKPETMRRYSQLEKLIVDKDASGQFPDA